MAAIAKGSRSSPARVPIAELRLIRCLEPNGPAVRPDLTRGVVYDRAQPTEAREKTVTGRGHGLGSRRGPAGNPLMAYLSRGDEEYCPDLPTVSDA